MTTANIYAANISLSVLVQNIEPHFDFLRNSDLTIELALIPSSLPLFESESFPGMVERWRDAGLRFSSLHYGIDLPFTSRDPAVQELADRRLVQAACAARLLGASILSHHSGFFPSRTVAEHHETAWLRSATDFLQRAERNGVLSGLTHCMENQFEDSFSHLETLHSRHGTCALFDLEHWETAALPASGMTALAALQRWSGMVRCLHVCDHLGVLGAHLPIGSGIVDWQGFSAGIRSLLPPDIPLVIELSNDPVDVEAQWGRSADLFRRHLKA